MVGDAAAVQPELSWYETKPLFGWRVLVPRTKADAAAVSEQLREQGAIPEEVPTIAVEPPRTPQQMDRAVRGLVTGRYQWVAFTSVNAVRAIREKFEEYGLDARAFAGVKVAAVGDQTAAALKDFGIAPDLVPDGEQSGQGLAAAWPPYDDVLDPINRVLLPRADIATENLVARLTELGWEAEDVTAYRTVRAAPPAAPIREAIKGGGFDAVLFTSSSTVRNLVGIAGKPHAVTVIAVIGPQTAKTAAEFGLRVDVMAPTPSMPVLVEALAEFGANQRRAALEAGEPLRKPSERRAGAPVSGSADERGVPGDPAAPAAAHGGAAQSGRGDRAAAHRPGAAHVRQGGHHRAAADRLHARRRPAHPGQPAQGGRGRGGGRAWAGSSCSASPRSRTAGVRPPTTRTASSSSRSVTWPPSWATAP